SVASVTAQKNIFVALNGASALSSVNGKIAGVSFALASGKTSNQFNMSSTYTTTPPSGVSTISDALMYMDFKTYTTSPGVDFTSSSNFDSTPKVSFNLGPQSGSVASSSPTNTVNGAITCPQPVVRFIANDGTTSSSGITISRDTNGDDNTSCGYTATLQHFSSYVVSASYSSTSTSSSSGSSLVLGPKLVDEPDDYVLRVMNSKYKLNELSSVNPVYIPVGTPVEIEINLSDAAGPNNISHVELYLNKISPRILNDLSETVIIYDRNAQNQIIDKSGLVDSFKITPVIKNSKAYFIFEITFREPFQLSDIMFRVWNSQRQGIDVYVNDVLAVILPEQPIPICHNVAGNTDSRQSIEIPKSELASHIAHGDSVGKCVDKTGSIKDWVKQYIELWQYGLIDDKTFKSGFGYLIDKQVVVLPDNKEPSPIEDTTQFKSKSMEWYLDEINKKEFLNDIKEFSKKLLGGK
ncbi:MAG: hypothetical protein ACKO7N_01945, partial [Candidatus Nitrosotenuis sp.]